MFGIDTSDRLSTTGIDTSYQAWDNYLAHIWYNLLYFCNIKSNSVVIEIAPGKSTKIAEALEKIVFRGEMHLVEPQENLCQELYDLYKQRLPHAKIYIHSTTLHNALDKLPKYPDALLSNHALDDMLLAETTYSQSDLFDWSERGEEQSVVPYQQIWKKLKQNSLELNRCINNLLNYWISAIEILHPKQILLNQYPSYHLSIHQLDDLNHQSSHILLQLRENFASQCVSKSLIQTLLNAMKNYNNAHIGLNVLNAEHWLIIKNCHD